MIATERVLLQQLDAHFQKYTTEGETLEGLAQYYIFDTGDDRDPEFGNALPLLSIEMGVVEATAASNPPCMLRKSCPVMFRVYTRKGDEECQITAAELIDRVERTLFQKQFGFADLLIDFTSKSYALPDTEILGEWADAGSELIYTYRYTDMYEITV